MKFHCYVKTSPSVCKENLPSQRATAKLTVPGARSPREVFGTAPPLFLHPPLRHRPLTGSHGARRSPRRSPSRCAARRQDVRDLPKAPRRRCEAAEAREQRRPAGSEGQNGSSWAGSPLPPPGTTIKLRGPSSALSPLGKAGERRLRLDDQEPIAVSAMRMRRMRHSVY